MSRPRLLICATIAFHLAGVGLHPARAQFYRVPWRVPVDGDYYETVYAPIPIIMQGHIQGGVNKIADASQGKTPLMLDVEAGDIEAILYLLGHGADSSLRDSNGETALDIARHLHLTRVQQILELDASINPPPSEYYAGKDPGVSILSGQDQQGRPGYFLPHPFTVKVFDKKDGRPMQNAPVRFFLPSGAGSLVTSPVGPQDSSLVLRTDPYGVCQAFFRAPPVAGIETSVEAIAGFEDNARHVVFNTSSTSTNRFYSEAFSITDCTGNIDSAGNLSTTWRNPTSGASCIKVSMRYEDGSFRVVAILPPNATSYFLKADEWNH